MVLIEHAFDSDQAAMQTNPPVGWATVLYAVLRSRNIVLATCVLGALLGLLYGAVQPNMYPATGLLRLRPGIRESTTPEITLGQTGRPVVSSLRESVADEVQLLRGPNLLDDVVDRVGAARILAIPDPTQLDDEITSMVVQFLHRFQAWWHPATALTEDGNGSASAP